MAPVAWHRTIAYAIGTPAMARIGSGHHQGVAENPMAGGRSSLTHCCIRTVSSRNAQPAMETTIPMIAARMSTPK